MSESEATPAKAVRDPETYREALDGWMKRQRPDAEALHVHDVDMPRATGFSNETVFFSASWKDGGTETTQRYVARIEPEGGALFPIQTPECKISVELQHRIMANVAATAVAPVPPTLPFEGDTSVLGRPFFVMEFVEGVIPADVPRYSTDGFLVSDASPAERERMVRSGVETMAALNRLDWKATGLDWLDPSGNGNPAYSDQIRIYRDRALQDLAGRDHPVLLGGLDWLEANAPDLPVGLSWGDSRLGNMIWQDYRCAAVVDWEAASLCPPQADIGWWVMFDRQSFDDMGAPRLEGFPTREEMVEIWETASGLSAGNVDYWEIYALMRFCAIMVGLGDRMVRAGLVPPENNMGIANGTTDGLARRLEAVA
jgi:aminoglycoside phosphotransferase (APT) family kinase protein